MLGRRAFGAAAAVAGALAFVLAVQVQAAEFCLHDPAVEIELPSEDTVTVYVTEGAYGFQHEAALNQAIITYKARAIRKSKSSLVTVYDLVPSDATGRFATLMIVSSQPFGAGTVYGSTTGTSGTVMAVSFTITAADRG